MTFKFDSVIYDQNIYYSKVCCCEDSCDNKFLDFKREKQEKTGVGYIENLFTNTTLEVFGIIKEYEEIAFRKYCITPLIFTSLSHNFEKLIFLSNILFTTIPKKYRSLNSNERVLIETIIVFHYLSLVKYSFQTISDFFIYSNNYDDEIIVKIEPSSSNYSLNVKSKNKEFKILFFLHPSTYKNYCELDYTSPPSFLNELVVKSLSYYTSPKKVVVKYNHDIMKNFFFLTERIYYLIMRKNPPKMIFNYLEKDDKDLSFDYVYAHHFKCVPKDIEIQKILIMTFSSSSFAEFNKKAENFETMMFNSSIGIMLMHPHNNKTAYFNIQNSLLLKEIRKNPLRFMIDYSLCAYNLLEYIKPNENNRTFTLENSFYKSIQKSNINFRGKSFTSLMSKIKTLNLIDSILSEFKNLFFFAIQNIF